MLEHVRGRVIGKSPTRVVIETAGLGFAVDVPLSTSERIQPDGEVSLLCHLIIGAQGPRLFGFASPEERALFRLLLSVNGVGPVAALSVLSGSSAAKIASAIRAEDEGFLKRIKGIGPKTARRIIVDLKERVGDLGLAAAAAAPEDRTAADAVAALLSLGFSRGEAEAAVARARQTHPDAAVEALLRESLKRI